MKKLLILVTMVMLCVLSGCSQDMPSQRKDMPGETGEVIQESTEESSITESSFQPSDIISEQVSSPTEDEEAQEEMSECAMPSNNPTEDLEQAVSESNVTQKEIPNEDVAIPDNSVTSPSETSAESQPTIDSENGSQTEPTDETQPIPESKPQQQEEIKSFDVSVFVEFAKNYAVEQGLKLDSTAVSCWDDPISANADSIYLERDIRDRLDWYCMSGFTTVWVWAEDLGNSQYDIYIGYA